MNPIREEEAEQRVPLMPSDLKNNCENSHIPYADENDPEESSEQNSNGQPIKLPGSRKQSLSSRRNVGLTININSSNPVQHNGDADSPTTPQTASDNSTKMDTPPLPLPRALRRNSISMPSGINAIEELEAFRIKHQMQEQEPVVEEEKTPSRTDSVVDDISGSVTISIPEQKNVPTIQIEKPDDDSDDELEIHGKRRCIT
uniref:Uncharacterized protein n=1 Tax=Musca domestica TaxID=7370 RepID=A0A1I8MVN0_MUSDO